MFRFFTLIAVFFLGSLAWAQAPQASVSKLFPKSKQALLVTGLGGVKAELEMFEKKKSKWISVAKIPAVIGRNGFAALDEKKEGDGKSPSGIYSLEFAFGSGPSIDSKFPYQQMTPEHKWIDDSKHADYNKLVRGPTTAQSFEEMKRKDAQYEFGLVIDYNREPIQKGLGSAIFLHVWKSSDSGTAGCVAIDRAEMLKLLKWLDPGQAPKIVMNASSALLKK